ncbi:hypothetical protein BDW68DRAFT_179611 [Aspergillus falconensis]
MESGNGVPGKRYHVKNTPVKGWEYQEVNLPDVRTTTALLTRILIAKIEDEERLIVIIRSIPVVQHDPDWRCCTRLANVLAALAKTVRSWDVRARLGKIERTARQYVAENTSAGRYQNAANLAGSRPTWDMLTNKQVVTWSGKLLNGRPWRNPGSSVDSAGRLIVRSS